jgi:hypothetical protein
MCFKPFWSISIRRRMLVFDKFYGITTMATQVSLNVIFIQK